VTIDIDTDVGLGSYEGTIDLAQTSGESILQQIIIVSSLFCGTIKKHLKGICQQLTKVKSLTHLLQKPSKIDHISH